MDRKEFEKMASEAIDSLPEEFLAKLDNVDVIIETAPSRETLAELGMNPGDELLGLYRGVPLSSRGTGYGAALPDIIVLYQEPIEKTAGRETSLKAEIRDVLMHEIGHHFGLEEEDMEHPGKGEKQC